VHTVADVWARAAVGEALPEHILCAVNREYAPPSAAVHDGDEVAFFPPVTGG
jgi:molybdopterin synthase sulfur carrier subunit